jgi:hypothetical protein
MGSLGLQFSQRFKTLRKPPSSCGSSYSSLDTSISEASFTSFPIDPVTKGPLKPNPEGEIKCSPSWGLIVALNQSDTRPELLDEGKLHKFAMRNSVYQSGSADHAQQPSEQPYPTAHTALVENYKDVTPSDQPIFTVKSASTQLGATGKEPPTTQPQPEVDANTTCRKSLRLAHRRSLSTLSDWFKPNATSGSGKHGYSKLQIGEGKNEAYQVSTQHDRTKYPADECNNRNDRSRGLLPSWTFYERTQSLRPQRSIVR